jgi:hypothetical protein
MMLFAMIIFFLLSRVSILAGVLAVMQKFTKKTLPLQAFA